VTGSRKARILLAVRARAPGRTLFERRRRKPMKTEKPAPADDGWRIGVLHSRSGATGVTESEHFFGTALAIEEINGLGGVLDRPLLPVAYDPKGDADEYRRLATRLLLEDEVNVIFGCSRSSSRKAVLPVIERNNALLWYCSFYEGFEYSSNVIYTGAVPNQNSVQLAAYLLKNRGRRFFLIGADYIFPRESNRVMREMVEQHGGEILDEVYVPLEATEAQLQDVMRDIADAQPDVIFCTIVGQSARRLYQIYREHGLDPQRMPIASLSMVEEEVRMTGVDACAGHITSATYFSSLKNESNAASSRCGASASATGPPACGPRWPTARSTCSRGRWSAAAAWIHASSSTPCAPCASSRPRAAVDRRGEQPQLSDAAHRRVPQRRAVRSAVGGRGTGQARPLPVDLRLLGLLAELTP
jgi:ABC-type branched-subunit amino acid transport system substrate-binding protein